MASLGKSALLVLISIPLFLFMSACDLGVKDNETSTLKENESLIKMVGSKFNNSTEFPEGEDNYLNRWVDFYHKVLGIDLSYTFVTTGVDYFPKLNASIATGDIPDVMQVDAITFEALYNSGKLADLTEAFDQYASDTVKQFLTNTETGKAAMEQVTRKGRLYGIPETSSASADDGRMLFIRADWMDKLGLQEPKSLQDVFQIAEAFTTQDPDNNGVDDTYGFAVANSFLFAEFGDLSGFFNGYHAYPRMWLKDGKGGLKYGSIQPEMKTALKALQELFNKGVLSSNLLVNTVESEWEAARNNQLGISYGNRNTIKRLKTMITKETPHVDWKVYPLMSLDGKPAKANGRVPADIFYTVKAGFSHPEAIIKMANEYVEVYYNTPNLKKKRNPLVTHVEANGKEISTDSLAFIRVFNPDENVELAIDIKEALQQKDPQKMSERVQGIVEELYDYPENINMNTWQTMRLYGEHSSFNVVAYYSEHNLIMKEEFTGPSTPTMLSKNSILDDIQYDYFTKIIMGEMDVDEFDHFVALWRKSGGDTITKEVNDWYQSKP